MKINGKEGGEEGIDGTNTDAGAWISGSNGSIRTRRLRGCTDFVAGAPHEWFRTQNDLLDA